MSHFAGELPTGGTDEQAAALANLQGAFEGIRSVEAEIALLAAERLSLLNRANFVAKQAGLPLVVSEDSIRAIVTKTPPSLGRSQRSQPPIAAPQHVDELGGRNPVRGW